jgi:fatty-acyl-CoA synthase
MTPARSAHAVNLRPLSPIDGLERSAAIYREKVAVIDGDVRRTYPQMLERVFSGGENISTVQVEKVILEHPGVLECAVVAKPHEKWGEVPKAFVTPKPGVALEVEDVVAHCRERLPGFKVPKDVEFGELPKTSTGKIQKYVLREREWGAREKRVN